MQRPQTRYAKSGDINIAYQNFGKGDRNLVVIPGWASNVEAAWTLPYFASFLNKLASFARVTLLDRRGTGLSDAVPNMPTIEERMDDVRAVMDHAGIERATIFGISEGGPMAIVFAASFPDRTDALALYGTSARLIRTEGYPAGISQEDSDKFVAGIEERWGTGKSARVFVPSRIDDEAFLELWGTYERNAMGPGVARRLLQLNTETDVRDVLPMLRVPTVIMHRTGDQAIPISLGRYLAEHIPGSKFVELPGTDHTFFASGEADDIVAEIQELLTGERTAPESDRILTTVMFADIVQSTEKAVDLGDRAWKDLLERYYVVVRDALKQYRGREIDTAGDGIFASFDGPARAVRCALSLGEAVRIFGFQLRVGVHTGECEIFGDKLSGIAVHLGARVAGKAGPGEVLVTSTVKDLVAGAGLLFEDHGEHALKGIPDPWRLYLARA